MLPDGEAAFIPCIGILVDDPGHSDDLVARVIAVYEHVDQPVPEIELLRRTLAKSFFPVHIRMYSKSRRKAPIYWQISVPSARYSVWLYVNTLHKDTFFRVQTNYVATKLAHEERVLDAMRQELRENSTAAGRRQLSAQESFIEELRGLHDEVRRVAPLWNPALDDGVLLMMAPLWRLVPQHKPWQRELKVKWDELAAGEYDWAHTAMHLWPERVIPKCATDRSLAIAHGLEDVFWSETAAGKWKRRPIPTRPIEELVRERTSVAVKAALKHLNEASAPISSRARTRRSLP
jgi:hypothetical protein